MNPLRVLFISLSKMPPALMLLLIIGLATVVTMMTTAKVQSEENSATDRAPVIISCKPIAAGTEITKSMVKQKRVHESAIWNDTITTTPSAVGRVAKHKIPEHAQIREIDLQ